MEPQKLPLIPSIPKDIIDFTESPTPDASDIDELRSTYETAQKHLDTLRELGNLLWSEEYTKVKKESLSLKNKINNELTGSEKKLNSWSFMLRKRKKSVSFNEDLVSLKTRAIKQNILSYNAKSYGKLASENNDPVFPAFRNALEESYGRNEDGTYAIDTDESRQQSGGIPEYFLSSFTQGYLGLDGPDNNAEQKLLKEYQKGIETLDELAEEIVENGVFDSNMKHLVIESAEELGLKPADMMSDMKVVMQELGYDHLLREDHQLSASSYTW